MMFRRYAIFYTPKPGPLADFGAMWLGWDPVRGRRVAHPDVGNVAVSEITQAPRKYGFHGTIKPPFSLAKGQSEAALRLGFTGFCDRAGQVVLGGLELAHLGRFLALVPKQPCEALNALAADVVQEFDKFRAPLTADDLVRRRARKLSLRQDQMLVRWGYPYMLDEFRFHMTLSGRISQTQRQLVVSHLAPVLAPMIDRPVVIDGLSLMGEDAAGMFHLLDRRLMPG